MKPDFDLNNLLDRIENNKDFVLFVEQLIIDLKQNPDNWENNTLESFLESMSAWVNSLEGFYLNQGSQSPRIDWKFIGQLLLASRIYE